MAQSPSRSGLSLVEVLASIGILSVGILGLAALLPVGQVTIFEAIKADRAGVCGRAAMRDVVVRRMLNYQTWYDPAQGKYVYDPSYKGANNRGPWYDQNGNPTVNLPATFIIDPLGATSSAGMSLTLGGSLTYVPRISLSNINALNASGNPQPQPFTAANAWGPMVFDSSDDLVTELPEQMTPRQPPGRPVPLWETPAWNASANPKPYVIEPKGDYSWFAAVSPTPNNPTRFTVSVVVFYRRIFNKNAEQAVPVKTFWDAISMGGSGATQGGGMIRRDNVHPDVNAGVRYSIAQGGGSLQLQAPIGGANGINVRENDWVALTGTNPQSPNYGVCRWYRVAAIGDDPSQLTLSGPDWEFVPSSNGTYPDMLVALGQDVVGVYTTTIDLDTDSTWTN